MLKKNGLYVLEVEYPLVMESGETKIVRDKVFGIFIGHQNCYFQGLVFKENSEPLDTMILTRFEFVKWVKSAREISE